MRSRVGLRGLSERALPPLRHKVTLVPRTSQFSAHQQQRGPRAPKAVRVDGLRDHRLALMMAASTAISPLPQAVKREVLDHRGRSP